MVLVLLAVVVVFNILLWLLFTLYCGYKIKLILEKTENGRDLDREKKITRHIDSSLQEFDEGSKLV